MYKNKLEYKAANRSSKITPKEFFILESTIEIGYGFAISKKRNKINPNTILFVVGSKNIINDK